MSELFKGYVMASEFAGWNSNDRLSDAKQHAQGEHKSTLQTMQEMNTLGYAGIEIAPFTVGLPLDYSQGNHRDRIRIIKNSIDAGNGAITGLHWILSFLNAVNPPKHGLSIFAKDLSSGGRVVTNSSLKETHAYYKLLIDYCADLGGTYMVHGSPPSRQVPDTFKENPVDAAAAFFDTYGPIELADVSLVEYAQKRNVRIGFEPLGAGETNFINTVKEGLELAEHVNHGNFGITIDVKAMAAEGKGQSIPGIIRSIGRDNVGKIVAVHFNDPSLTGPRPYGIYKQSDWEYIMGALTEIGWDGLITIEPFKQYSSSILDDCKQILDFLTGCEKNVAGK